jgi:PEGA domain
MFQENTSMKKLIALGSLAALLCSCGSIVNGSTQPVCITSQPTCAKVFVDQQFVGQTPIRTKVTRKDRHIVRLEAPGYEPYEVILDRRMSKWVLGNIVFGGLPGVAIDAVSGGLYKVDPNTLHAFLYQKPAVTQSEPSTVG